MAQPQRDAVARIVARRAARQAAGSRRRRIAGRSLALLAAVAVPALAAPDEWRMFDVGAASHSEVTVEPMPFEKPGDSFPGSAFYYLASEADELQSAEQFTLFGLQLGEGIHSDAEPANPASGPLARAMRIDNSGVDRSRAEQCLTAALYYEARSEPDAGQRAVAQVILNRVAHKSYPDTVCGVVYQGSERTTGCQFSFTCDGSLARRPQPYFWERAAEIARAALAGYVYAPVGLATHYHTFAVHPVWSPKMFNIANIGAHRFFRMNGPAGQPGAFRFAYAGNEPMAGPHAKSAAADLRPDIALDPLAIQRAYEAGFKSAQQAAPAAVTPTATGLAPVRAAPAPNYAPELRQRGGESIYRGEKLPEATGIRPEYENSGRWIANPGT